MVGGINKRLVKLLDFRFHQTNPVFKNKVSPYLPMSQRILVRHIDNSGGAMTLCEYWDISGKGDWIIGTSSMQMTAKEVTDLLDYFEDTSKITDEEWGLFAVCYPDLLQGLGKMTDFTSRIELYLSGRVNIQVEYK